MCFILYVFKCSLYVVYVLPIQLLGCHSCNKLKRLSLSLSSSVQAEFWVRRPNIFNGICTKDVLLDC